jgi:hypothetical protein
MITMDKVFETLVALQVRMFLGRTDDERGQGTLEYVGMIIVAAGIVVAVLQAAGAIDLGAIFTDNVSKVTDGGGN